MYVFVEISCVMAEMWMAYFLFGGMFQRKPLSGWIPLVLYAATGGILSVLSFGQSMAFIRIGFTFAALLCIGFTQYETDLLHSAIVPLVLCVMAALADVLTSLVLSHFGFEMQALMAHGAQRSIYLISDHIVLFGLVFGVYSVMPKQTGLLPLKLLLPVLPCWVVSCLLCILLAWQMVVQEQDVSPLYLIVLVGMLYTNFIVIYHTNTIYAQAQEKQEREIAEHHYAMQQEYYDQFRIQQEETRALWHDISKLLRAVQAENSGQAINQVESMLSSVTSVVDVDNRVISVILNEYAQATRNAGIQLDMDVQVPKELFVSAVDLYILIGNTMENAIEACLSLPEEKRAIRLKLKVHNSILFYKIENTFALSHASRPRGKMHGYGLKNVQRCVEKYRGTLEVEQEKDIFLVVAHLNSN